MKKEIIILTSLIALNSINLKNNRNINLEDESFIVDTDLEEIPEELKNKKIKIIDFSLSKIEGNNIIDFVQKLDYKLDEIKINPSQLILSEWEERITELNDKIKKLVVITKAVNELNPVEAVKIDGPTTEVTFNIAYIKEVMTIEIIKKIKEKNLLPDVEIITFIDKKN